MHMQASLLASTALTAEVGVLKQDLEGSRKELSLAKRHRVEGRQSRRRLKATFRTSGAEGARPPRAPSLALSRTPRRNLQWFRTRQAASFQEGQDAYAGDLCLSRGAGQSAGSASQRFHRRGAPHYHECGDPEGSVRQERID